MGDAMPEGRDDARNRAHPVSRIASAALRKCPVYAIARPVFGSYEKRPPSLRMKDKFLVFRLFGETLASERRSM